MAETLIEAFLRTAEEHAERPAMRHKGNGSWHTTTWSEYRSQMLDAARGFIELGLESGQGVAIIGFNRPEWFIADYAAIAAGGVLSGIYTTCTAEQCHYIAEHSEAGIAVVENQQQLAKFLEIRDSLPRLRAIVLMDGESDVEGVVSWPQLQALGAAADERRLQERIDALDPQALCTLIYTSGTTGPPKAVMLSHHNLLWTAGAVIDHFNIYSTDKFLSYLPLSHIAEQMVTLHAPMILGACTCFAESLEKLPENLREIRPHIFFGVPRVWEKIEAAIAAAGAQNPPLRRKIAAWARKKGLAGGYAAQRGESMPAFYGLADRLVFSKVRDKLGLDRARVCACAAAPISLHTLEFFLSLGIPILEVYGMSECTGPTTMSTPTRHRTGRAGFAIPGTELKTTDEGEICMRGPHVFLGYYKDEAATAEALDEDGWLHSGDVGVIGQDGFLRVTDRIKELIITSGGKNIAPQMIEAKLKSLPSVALAAVIGDRRKYLSALICLDPERLDAEIAAAGSPAKTATEASTCSVFRAYLTQQIEEVNVSLASYETIKTFAVLAEPFSIEGGELTPTMKLKRRVVAEKYVAEIDGLYE